MEISEEITSLKNEYENKIANLKAVLSKAKLAYDQQKNLYLEKVFFKKFFNREIKIVNRVMNLSKQRNKSSI